MIYFDNHSATKPCAPALERMRPYLEEEWGASFAPHRFGQQLIQALDARYQMIYEAVGAEPKETFVFTSSGAEATTQVLWSAFLEIARKEGKTHFVTSGVEDAPTMQMLRRLEELGCSAKIVPVDGAGRIDLEKLKGAITPRTALISLGMAQGLTGVVQPFEEVLEIAREKKVRLHLDATYAVGKLSLFFTDWGVDYLTFSGDRIHSVKGSGGLFAKEGAPLAPLLLGGPEQGQLRGGTFDIPSFMALSAAMQQASLTLDRMNLEVVRLRDLLEQGCKELFGAQAVADDTLRLPNVTTLLFPGVHQEALLYALNRKNLFASIGGPYAQHLHRLLEAMGIDPLLAKTAVSFSLSRMTTQEEVEKALHLLGEIVPSLQRLSEGVFR